MCFSFWWGMVDVSEKKASLPRCPLAPLLLISQKVHGLKTPHRGVFARLRHGHILPNPRQYPPLKRKSTPLLRCAFRFGGGWWIRTTEVSDNRFTVCPLWPLGKSPKYTVPSCETAGAGERSRTINLLITNQLLCH